MIHTCFHSWVLTSTPTTTDSQANVRGSGSSTLSSSSRNLRELLSPPAADKTYSSWKIETLTWQGKTRHNIKKLDDGWPESEKNVFQAALSMVVVKNSRW